MEKKKSYYKTAESILKFIGGKENIVSAAHCATRLRLVLKDESIISKEQLEKLDLVKGMFTNGGQYQIILGQGIVNKVYEEFAKLAEIKEMTTSDVKSAAMKKLNPFQRLARTLSDIFVPIIPAIVAAGLLMGLLGAAGKFGLDQYSGSWWWSMLDWFSSAAFIFLPILVAISAAKVFGANPYLAATIGGIMIHPALQNAWTQGEGYQTMSILGIIDMPLLGYQGTVLPILIVVFVMAYIEKSIRKIVPEVLDILLTPLLTVLITGFLALAVIGPAANFIGHGISTFLTYSLDKFGLFAGLLFGGSYSSIVITGIHHSFHAVELGLIADTGYNTLLPIWSMANFAQGGAALAVYFMTKNAKMKSISLPSAISAFVGITEAAIFGVNLKYVKPFIGAAIGGAVAGAYVVFTKVAMTAVGVTGLPALTIVTSSSMLNYIIGLAIALVVSFVVTYILGIKEEA
ncbi:sucrose-specific PTS transporter subunit IIBC [Clostridium chauvoei]|uniref:Sucrose-specific PTS transporter subunit IIBC n=2 Tax=Clostridium chauvoei TaxID=46867 RepID=A0ABD4RIZ7_9CLOT|nr:sucrose-specific PTS transporter subunit IIBC [Clostridium chauvoei]ATD55533.1 PTS sucrose transporter subunit IIBC [Clostridium chauvoei]ATD56791.1 PTS sucrose transporter subunit IIBC [Clostridium chauvoei]MBX7281221.1 sucrose-specific PTS transporter subunit IIBC [Clostridium chauvoei]MBX7283703.1 sucrose-specific PTS transporter subunit IIBC [Clostridium chauvoei]MBX7286311.1 sucrose-specific PTS transporter subunit IIBC [Clostridium chauvoei]